MFRKACAFAILSLYLSAAGAQDVLLKPYQQVALEKILATMDAPTQAAARPQLQQVLVRLGEAEVEMMLAAMAAESATVATTASVAEETPAAASEDDLKFNRAQYEPAIRRSLDAGRRFDTTVDAQLAKHCPEQGIYAVYGMAWRYEVMPLTPNWPRSSENPDRDTEILGTSYAPQDGRYRFDFRAVRSDFDQAAVEQAIADACLEYRKIGEAFMTEARAGLQEDDLPGGSALEGRSNARVAKVLAGLEQTLQTQAPGADGALFQALISAERVK